MPLVSAYDRAVEHIQRGEQRRRAVALIVMRHGPGAALLQRQAGLGPVERLDLTLFVDGQHNGVSRWINVEADDIAQLADELRIVGKLELPHPVRLKPVGAPDALNRTDGNTSGLCHQRAGPMGGLAGRVIERQSDDPRGGFIAQRLDARGPRLVAQKAVKTFIRKALLPAPDAGFRLARLAHDPVGAHAIGGEHNDPAAPDMLLRGVAVLDHRKKAAAVGGRNSDGYSGAHAPDSHTPSSLGIPSGIQMSDFIH